LPIRSCLVDGDEEALPERITVCAVDVEFIRVARLHLWPKFRKLKGELKLKPRDVSTAGKKRGEIQGRPTKTEK
jgi:hypothetical protein